MEGREGGGEGARVVSRHYTPPLLLSSTPHHPLNTFIHPSLPDPLIEREWRRGEERRVVGRAWEGRGWRGTGGDWKEGGGGS
jgi:hypothetical protein